MKTLLVALAATFFTLAGQAAPGDPADVKWHECEKKVLTEYGQAIANEPKIFETDFCAYIGLKPGQECDMQVMLMQMHGVFRAEVHKFALTKAEKTCGKHPE